MTDEKLTMPEQIAQEKEKADAAAGRIDKLGGSLNGLAEAQHSHMLEWIYNNLLTEANREDFMLSWYTTLNEQLAKLEGQFRDAAVAKQQLEARSNLAVPGSPGFILPRDVRRTGRRG